MDIIRYHSRKFGRCPVALLLDETIGINERMCFVVMTSFGPESRAGKEAIRKRMGVKSLTTVKQAQKKLVAAFYITKSKEGGGDDPNEWDIYDLPTDNPRYIKGNRGTTRPGKNKTPRPQGAPEPGHDTPPKQEGKSRNTTTTSLHQEIVDDFCVAWAAKVPDKKRPEKYRPTPADLYQLKLFLKAQPDLNRAAFRTRIKNYLRSGDAFVDGKRFPMMYLFTQWNSWGGNGRNSKAGRSQGLSGKGNGKNTGRGRQAGGPGSGGRGQQGKGDGSIAGDDPLGAAT